MKPKREIQVEVVFTPGYEKRFTEACLKQLGKDAVKMRTTQGYVFFRQRI